MLLCIFDDDDVRHLYPLTRTRAACMLRTGHATFLETARRAYPSTGVVLSCRPELADVVREQTNLPVNRIADGVDVLFLNGRLVDPAGETAASIMTRAKGQATVAFYSGEVLIAAWVPADSYSRFDPAAGPGAMLPSGAEHVTIAATLISRLWHILDHIEGSIRADFDRVTSGYNVFERPGAEISPHAVLVNGEHIVVGARTSIRAGCVLDASEGPIIIGADVTIFENCVLRGPLSVGERTQVKAASVMDRSIIGPWCKTAGEIHGSIIHGFSNKAHPGYLGDSILGSWCNLGADTNTSNLRNDYGSVTLYNEWLGEREDTGRIFAGLFMGDHSKCGINVMFNTGTVIGVSCNLYGAGFQPRHIPSFLWGSPDDRYTTYRFQKAVHVARAVMARRDRVMSKAEEELLQRIFDDTEAARESGPRQ